jgi:hypothetical protein
MARHNRSRMEWKRIFPIWIGLLSLLAVSQGLPKLEAPANNINPSAVALTPSDNPPHKTRKHRERNKKAKGSLKNSEAPMNTSDGKNDNRNARHPQKGSKAGTNSGNASAGSGAALPQETTGEGANPSETPKDRDKILDQVNLPVPVPPGEVSNPPASPVDPATSPGAKVRSTSKASANANRQPSARKPPRRKHEE